MKYILADVKIVKKGGIKMRKVISAFLTLTMCAGLFAVSVGASGKTLTASDIKEKSETGVAVQGDRVKGFNDGGYIGFGEVDFTGIKSVRLKLSQAYMIEENGEAFRLYIDDPLKGTCIGYVIINEQTEEPGKYYGTNIEGVTGTHKFYIKQNYSHSNYLTLYDVVLSEEEWVDPKAVTPVSDDKIIDNYADTWTATNAYGLRLADFEETGGVKAGNHEVGMFYHDWHLHNTKAYIASEIISKYPEAKDDYNHTAWPSSGPAWWDEPVYGFYDDTDYWHYRKSAELMADAGVDVVFLDYTNGDSIYAKGLDVMMRAYHDAREDGVNVPKISGYLQMGSSLPNRWRMLKAIYFNLCYNEYYKDLWYYWDGKPLMIQNGYAENIKAVNSADSEEVALANELIDFFTFRETGDRWKGDTTQNKYWHWLVNYPQPEWGYTESGRTECVNLGMAINESYLYKETRVGVFSEEYTKGKSYTEAFGEDYRPEAVHEGYFFREQASRVLEIDPEFCFIDGWNEYNTARGRDYYGVPNAFIDLYNDEKSRDFEPTKGEVKDDYYNILVDFIRKYKGVRPAPVASAETAISINGGEAQWANVLPEYINDYGAYERDALGYKDYDTGENYVYKTEVVNSISRAKVARDADNLYFYAVCESDINMRDNNSMNLYLNTDRNYPTGWEGYDYVVSGGKVYKFADGSFDKTEIGTAEYAVSGKTITVKVPKALIGYNTELEFKWTDNIDAKGDIMLFYTEGNAAPVGRFNYLYTEIEQTALSQADRANLTDVSVVKAGAKKMVVNGGKMNVYDKDTRVTAFEANGTIYLPMSAVEEILGNGKSKVYYDSLRNKLHIKNHRLTEDEKIDMHWSVNVFGSLEMKVDGKLYYTANPATVVNGVIYIPATMLETAFGWRVSSLGNGAYAIGSGEFVASAINAAVSHIN